MDATPQEWHSTTDLYAADLYNEEKTIDVPANPVPESKTAASQLSANHLASEQRGVVPTLSILSAYGKAEIPSQFHRWHAVTLGFLVLLIVSVLGIGAWYLLSQGRSVTQTAQQNNPNPGTPTENPSTATSDQPTSTVTPKKPTMVSSADEEIERLQERRIGANPSENVEIISAIEQGEKKYPTDYRFPYELSKLSIKGITSHHEAFEPLARAAQKAIDNGQADEMLNGLMTDKDEDFYKLSHGHREWKALEDALRSRDRELLKASIH